MPFMLETILNTFYCFSPHTQHNHFSFKEMSGRCHYACFLHQYFIILFGMFIIHLFIVKKLQLIQSITIKSPMGNENTFCNSCQDKTDSPESKLRLKESACVEIIDNLPTIRGKFNFEKQTSFNKIERAASEYCQNNFIEKIHVPIVARLLAYQQHHYFEVIKQLPLPLREKFVLNQEKIDIELMDSLYTYFVIKQQKKANPQLFLGAGQIKQAPTIDISQISRQNLEDLVCQGLYLLREGKVALVIMAAGQSQFSYSTSKSLTPLPLLGDPTAIQILLQRYATYLKPQQHSLSTSDATVKHRKKAITPIIIICCQKNYQGMKQMLKKNRYFGFEENYIKILMEDRTVPFIDSHGKLCISFEEKTLSHPAGTAMAVAKVLEPKVRSFLECCYVDYIHFIGCENIAEIPGDPLMLGLVFKFGRKIAGKCVTAPSLYQKYPRYVASKSAFHLLDVSELDVLGDVTLLTDSPLALNSLLFKFSSLVEFYNNYQTNLYIARRFHMSEIQANYYDFQQKKPVQNSKVFIFQQDIRDYISASTETIVVKYRSQHFMPIMSTQQPQIQLLCEKYKQPPLY